MRWSKIGKSLRCCMMGLVALCACAPLAYADDAATSSGRWRLELQGLKALSEDHSDRNGAAYYTASVEYEWPLLQRCTLSLRLYPVFIYPGHGDVNYGAALGGAARVYQHADVRNGLFAELGIAALATAHDFTHNDSEVNFLNEIGVGYQFENNWHLALKFEHISNAGLASPNRGVNAIGLGLGYSF